LIEASGFVFFHFPLYENQPEPSPAASKEKNFTSISSSTTSLKYVHQRVNSLHRKEQSDKQTQEV
jgi:hypothetical protein